MISQKALFTISIFGFICGFIAVFLGIGTHTSFSIIVGSIGMIGNGINMLRFKNF